MGGRSRLELRLCGLGRTEDASSGRRQLGRAARVTGTPSPGRSEGAEIWGRLMVGEILAAKA